MHTDGLAEHLANMRRHTSHPSHLPSNTATTRQCSRCHFGVDADFRKGSLPVAVVDDVPPSCMSGCNLIPSKTTGMEAVDSTSIPP